MLFTILVSDIANGLQHCKYHLYADDTQIYISGKVGEIENLIKLINIDLQTITEFSVNNCLKLNEGKSVFIIIGSKRNIAKVNEYRISDIKVNNKKLKEKLKSKILELFLMNICPGMRKLTTLFLKVLVN